MKHILTILLAVTLFAGCGSATKNEKKYTPPKAARMFPMVMPPVGLSDSAKVDYMRFHYWDRFDFRDTTLLHEIDSMEMLRAYAGFVQLMFSHPEDGTPMDSLMARTRTSRHMMDYFVDLASKAFGDPNSPLRNDEFYIPVLRAQLAAPWYDQWERMAPEHDLRTAMLNRIGHKANDFRYTLASGATGRLHTLKADFVIIFINNPGCEMCRTIREAISASELLQGLLSAGRLKILAVYPDEDLTEWHDYRKNIPPTWINAYDKGCHIEKENLYNLAAIPALYLLDSDKRVLVKDSTSVEQIEATIASLL